jgi:hypothetical protein
MMPTPASRRMWRPPPIVIELTDPSTQNATRMSATVGICPRTVSI